MYFDIRNKIPLFFKKFKSVLTPLMPKYYKIHVFPDPPPARGVVIICGC